MFKKFGFFKEYYIGNKFIGLVACDKDRDKFGFFGKQKETLSEDLILTNKRKIKKGIEVETMLFEYCGQTQK